jgi:hypothetical protein
MERVDDVLKRADRLRALVVRLWRSRHPAWWYRLLARMGAAQLAGFAAPGIIEELIWGQGLPHGLYRLVGWGSLLIGFAFGVYSYVAMEDPQPPQERVPADEWGSRAAEKGMWLAVGVFYTTMLLCYFLLLGIGNVLNLMPWLPTVLHITVRLVLLGLSLLLSVILAVLAYRARYRQEIEILEATMPPGLRLAHDLHLRADWFHEHAEALERAMEQAADISRQVQHEIMLEHQQLGELHEQALRQARLNEITPEQASAVARVLGDQVAGSEQRGKRSNIRIAFVFYLLGAATPIVVSTDSVRGYLPEWLRLP